jgi:branched-chain amino acid transport system substrate-binding protein
MHFMQRGKKMVRMYSALALASVAMIALSAGQSMPADSDPIVVGMDMAFSGWFQPIDDSTEKGIELAVDDINAAGGVLGRKLKIERYDMKSEPPLGADGAIDLISRGAKAILVSSDFDFGAPGSFIAQSKGIITFAGASDPKFGVTGVGNMAFSVSTPSRVQGAMDAEWAHDKKGFKTAYVLLDNTINVTKSSCAEFTQRWKKIAGADSLLGEDTFLNSDPSIASQITRILALSKKPDVIYLCSYVPGGASAIRQLRAAGVNQPILSAEPLDGDYWLGMVPDLSNFYVTSLGAFFGGDPDKGLAGFFERFAKKYGKPADVSYGVRGYSEVEAFARAVERAKSTEGAAVSAELEKFKNEPLTIGPTTFTPQIHMGGAARAMTFLEVTNGKYHVADKYAIKEQPDIQY